MNVGQRSEMVAVVVVSVIPGIREVKKTRRCEKRYWTHRDQQQDGDRGVNVNYKHPQSISATRGDPIGLVQPGYNPFRVQWYVQW